MTMGMFAEAKHKRDSHGRWSKSRFMDATSGDATRVPSVNRSSSSHHDESAAKHADKAVKLAEKAKKLTPGSSAHDLAHEAIEHHAGKAVAHAEAASAVAHGGPASGSTAHAASAEKHAHRAVDALEAVNATRPKPEPAKPGEAEAKSASAKAERATKAVPDALVGSKERSAGETAAAKLHRDAAEAHAKLGDTGKDSLGKVAAHYHEESAKAHEAMAKAQDPAKAVAARQHAAAQEFHEQAAKSATRTANYHVAMAAHHKALAGGGKSTEPAPLRPTAQNIRATMDAHKDTQAMFFNTATHPGKWDPSRQPIHDEYNEATTHGVPKSLEGSTVHMTGGGPASGKTKAILENPDTGIPDKAKAAHINPDDAKEHIPEYNAALQAAKIQKQNGEKPDERGAGFAHEESSFMVKRATQQAIQNGHDVVLDTTGDSGIDKLHEKVAQMRAQGAKKIVAHYATIDVDEALHREQLRAEKTGRKVAEGYLRATHSDVTTTALGAIKRGTFDQIDIWDNGVKQGEKPIHVMTATRNAKGDGSDLKIHDPAAFERFKARGAGNSKSGG